LSGGSFSQLRLSGYRYTIGADRGAPGARVTPQGGENFLGVIYRGKLQVHPQTEQDVKCLKTFLLGGEIWRMGVINVVVLACVLRAMTEKGR